MAKISKDTLMIVASNLTIAEMVYGMEPDSKPAAVPSDYVYDRFLQHLRRLAELPE